MKVCMPFHNKEAALLYQMPVYQSVRRCILEHGSKSVLDIGCGNPQKLKAYVYPFVSHIVGIDLHDIIVKISADFGEWFACDLEKDKLIPFLDLEEKFDIIILADVIEHINNVENLFDIVKRHAHRETFIILSSPERALEKPENIYHVREYTKDEFIHVLKDNKLDVKVFTPYVERGGRQNYVNNLFVCLVEN